jgi:hypothetical protein
VSRLLPLSGPNKLPLRVAAYAGISFLSAQFLKTRAAEIIFDTYLRRLATYPRHITVLAGIGALLKFEHAVQRVALDAAYTRGQQDCPQPDTKEIPKKEEEEKDLSKLFE